MNNPINIGMSEADRTAIANGLAGLLADTYTLYLKTHNFHWNVKGPMFNSLHLMFETQYAELALAVDEIAERIRALGLPAPGSYREFASLTKLSEAKGGENAMQMVAALAADHEAVSARARSIFDVVEKANDQPSADLLTRRMDIHEKTAWMLRSTLED
ncbi:MAG: Dps family protein [Robiginitomaculum sp.]|nr:Dps family protein [Robiginitomaculum sp.]MDQ7078345.1 Dps family protein [Robiginitomaculum sp.]